jgi:hypothetical protein
VAKEGMGWLRRGMGGLGGGWVAKLVAIACYGSTKCEFGHHSKIINGRHTQRSGPTHSSPQKNFN